MTPEQKERSIALKKRKKDELEAIEFAGKSVKPFLEILDEFRVANVRMEQSFMIIPQTEWLPVLQNLFLQEPYNQYDLSSMEKKNDFPLLNLLFEKYPSQNPFRYVPEFHKLAEEFRFKDIVQHFQLKDKSVYFCYLPYAFVVRLNIAEILEADEEALFNPYHGDVVIFPEDVQWLLAYSLEEEWRFTQSHLSGFF